MIEEWKDVEGYEGLYKVSNTGKVFDYRLNRESKTNFTSGYKYVYIKKSGSLKGIAVHRLVAKTFIPNPDKLPIVNHKDLDKTNNYASNLEWITYKGNSMHYQEEKRKGNKAKDAYYFGHIKVYSRSEEEQKIIKEFANKKGFSASAWLLSLALKEIKREEKK